VVNKTKKSLSNAFGNDHPITLGAGIVPSGGGAEGNEQSLDTRKVTRHLVPILTAMVIGSFSGLEILKNFREIGERQLGHAHGIVVLAFIRLCRSIAILQTQAEEFEEQVEEVEDEIGFEKRIPILSTLGKIIISPVVTIAACLFATFASAVKIFDDMKPGAHHGAALLALSELYYQLRCFRKYRRKGKPTTTTEMSPIARVLSIIPFGALIALAAAGYAGIEIYEDMRPGAHHAVAMLALAELVENINRSKIIH
jgi:hypothetical protein